MQYDIYSTVQKVLVYTVRYIQYKISMKGLLMWKSLLGVVVFGALMRTPICSGPMLYANYLVLKSDGPSPSPTHPLDPFDSPHIYDTQLSDELRRPLHSGTVLGPIKRKGIYSQNIMKITSLMFWPKVWCVVHIRHDQLIPPSLP